MHQKSLSTEVARSPPSIHYVQNDITQEQTSQNRPWILLVGYRYRVEFDAASAISLEAELAPLQLRKSLNLGDFV